MRKYIATATLAAALAVGASQTAQAESKGYIVSLWVPAMNNPDEKVECPQGKNAAAPEILTYTLNNQGMPKSEIDKIVTPEMSQRTFGEIAGARGRKDGKPVNVYMHPLSVPDPNIRLDQRAEGFGFNLDGKVEDLDYTDPITKEAGVDNNAARVFGCFDRTRGTYEAPPGNQSFRWQNHYNAGASWLMEVTNNSDRPINWQNDDNITIKFYRGMQVPLWNSAGHQRNVTYTIDPHAELHVANSFKGKIVNGEFVSDRTNHFKMIASSRVQPVYDFKAAKMRATFKPNGDLEAFVGGYLPIKMVYFPFGDYATAAEYIGGMDVPGVYHALKRLADTDIDAVNGQRTRISMTYMARAVPAYLVHTEQATNAKKSSRK